MIEEPKFKFYVPQVALQNLPEEEYEAIEMAQDGQIKLYRLRPMLSRFLVDEQGKPIEQAAAMKMLGKFTLAEWEDIVKMFVEGIRDASIPKESGTKSEPPSEQSTED